MAEVRKRKSRRRVPWGQILGKPIERVIAASEVDVLFERAETRDEVRRQIEQGAWAKQFEKMRPYLTGVIVGFQIVRATY